MQTKMFEIRDEGTCIPVLAIKMKGATAIEARYLWREGYLDTGSAVIVMKLSDQKATVDPYEWDNRTMAEAHNFIYYNFDSLREGQVVDVRVLMGTQNLPAAPEIWNVVSNRAVNL